VGQTRGYKEANTPNQENPLQILWWILMKMLKEAQGWIFLPKQ